MRIMAMRITGAPITTMADAAGNLALYRLMAWLSPAFPVGSFSYSHGLERAVHDGLTADRENLADWIEALISQGSGWNDMVLMAESWRRAGSKDDLAEAAQLAEALAGSAERRLETTLQGAAFLKAASAWVSPAGVPLPEDAPYCVAVGAVAGAHGVPLRPALAAFCQAFASNLVQAGIRLSVIGQTDGVAIVAHLEPLILDTVARAAGSTPDDLGAATFLSDIVAMRHETQYSRLFRS